MSFSSSSSSSSVVGESQSVRSVESGRSSASAALSRALRQRREVFRGAAEVARAEEEARGLKARVGLLEEERAALQSRLRALEEERAAVEGSVARVREEERAAARRRLALVVERHKAVLAELRQLQAQVQALQGPGGGSFGVVGAGGGGGGVQVGGGGAGEAERGESIGFRAISGAVAQGFGTRASQWTETVVRWLKKYPPVVHLLGVVAALTAIVVGVQLAKVAALAASRGALSGANVDFWHTTQDTEAAEEGGLVLLTGLPAATAAVLKNAHPHLLSTTTTTTTTPTTPTTQPPSPSSPPPPNSSALEFVSSTLASIPTAAALQSRVVAAKFGVFPCDSCLLYPDRWPSLLQWPPWNALLFHFPLILVVLLFIFFLRGTLRATSFPSATTTSTSTPNPNSQSLSPSHSSSSSTTSPPPSSSSSSSTPPQTSTTPPPSSSSTTSSSTTTTTHRSPSPHPSHQNPSSSLSSIPLILWALSSSLLLLLCSSWISIVVIKRTTLEEAISIAKEADTRIALSHATASSSSSTTSSSSNPYSSSLHPCFPREEFESWVASTSLLQALKQLDGAPLCPPPPPPMPPSLFQNISLFLQNSTLSILRSMGHNITSLPPLPLPSFPNSTSSSSPSSLLHTLLNPSTLLHQAVEEQAAKEGERVGGNGGVVEEEKGVDGEEDGEGASGWFSNPTPTPTPTPTTPAPTSPLPSASSPVLVAEYVPAWSCPLVLLACALPPPLVLLVMVASSPAAGRELTRRMISRAKFLRNAIIFLTMTFGHALTLLVLAVLTDASASSWLFRFNIAHALVGIGARFASTITTPQPTTPTTPTTTQTAQTPPTTPTTPSSSDLLLQGLFRRATVAALARGDEVGQEEGGEVVEEFVAQAASAVAAAFRGGEEEGGVGGVGSGAVGMGGGVSNGPAGLLRVHPTPGLTLLVPDIHPAKPLALLLFWFPVLFVIFHLVPLILDTCRELLDEVDIVGVLIRASLGVARTRAKERQAAMTHPTTTTTSTTPTTTTPPPHSSTAPIPPPPPPSRPATLRLLLVAATTAVLVTWYRHVTLRQPWGAALGMEHSLITQELGTSSAMRNKDVPLAPVPAATGAPPGWLALMACPLLLLTATHLAAAARTMAIGYTYQY